MSAKIIYPISIKEVCEITKLSRSTIYRLIICNDFPKSFNASRKLKKWDREGVYKWMSKRAKESKG